MQDPQENQKFSVQEYATAIREKYPQYEGYEDADIVNAFVEKFPEIKSQIDFGEEPSKKKDATVSPYTSEEGKFQYSPSNSREDLLKQFRETTGLSEKDVPDGVIAYSAAQLYPELKETLGVRTEGYEVDWDELSQKAKTKKRTIVDNTPTGEEGEEINAFKIIDEGDASDFLDGTHVGKIYNRAIASSEIGKITSRSFYGGSIDFDELAYYSEVLDKNAGENWMGSFGETAVGGFLADLMRTLPESMISLVDSSLSPEAAATAGVGAAAGSVVPVIGTAAGAAGGAAFAGSGMLTFGSTLLQKLREEGVDVSDPAELEKAWNNKEMLIPLAKEAAAKAGIVGMFDAVSAGLGGTISKSAIKSGAKVISAEAREYAVEGALGGAGEAFGSLAAGDEINMRDVALEMVADPAAGITGRGIKAVLGKNADPDEQKILNKIDENKERTLKELKISKIENAEVISKNKSEIEELEAALKNAPREQKKLIKKEINRLQKENTSIHANELDNLSDFTDEEIEEMGADADEIISLVAGMESSEMTEENKQAVAKIVDNKAKALKDKRNKRKKGGINVSSTSRETGAPAKVNPDIEKIEAQRKAEIEFLENMDVSPEANYGITTEEERQEAIKQANEKYDSQRAKIEPSQDFDFAQPDAAQGFEDFMDSEEAPITPADEAKEADDFAQLQSEIPDVQPEEAPSLVQKRKDNKGREVKSYSQTVEENGVKKTEYYSERDGERVPSGGVVFNKNEGFDKLLEAFNIPEDEFTEAVGDDVEAVAMTASETDGKKGKVSLMVKKADGVFDIEVPFIEGQPTEAAPAAQVEEAPDVEEVDDSLSAEGKEAAQLLADSMEKAVEALKAKDPNTLTEEEIQTIIDNIGVNETPKQSEGLDIPDFEEAPLSAYQDFVDMDMEGMSAEDMAAMDDYFSGESKELTLGLGYIKKVSDAIKSSTSKKVDAKLEETQSKINSSLSSYLKESLKDAQSFTQFIAENAMQGDFFTVGKALYRIGEVTEVKAKSTAAKDIKVFKALKDTGKTNVKAAVDSLYQKVMDKTITKEESKILDSFERGRFKEIKNKNVSIDDIISLLNVLEVTGKDGKAAVKQAFAMAKDKKTVGEFLTLREKLLEESPLTDKNGKPVLNKAGYKQIDWSNVSKEETGRFYTLMKRVGQINKMKDFTKRIKAGKFKEVNAKKGAIPITKYMADRGVQTSAGNGVTRTVKFQRYSRKTGEALPTVTAGKRKEVIRKRKTEFREYKEEQYTATIKDGKLVRKATNSQRITAAFGKMGNASYTRFRPEVTTGKAEKQSGAKFRRSKETRAKVAKTFSDDKSINALLLRPKNKSSLVSSISKVFNLHADRAEGAAEISHRLIQNMARRAGVKPSEIYDKITLVKNEYKGERTLGESITSPRAIGTILRRFGAPISESNLDENGNPIDFAKLDQKSKPITTDFKKYKQKGVEDSFTAQMIEDLKGLGINIMSKKGSALENISELAKDKGWDGASDIRKALGEPTSKNRLLDTEKAINMPYIQSLVRNNIAAYLRIPVEELNQEMLDLYGTRTGQKNPILFETRSYVEGVRGQQNQRASNWLSWLERQGTALNENPTQENLAKYARAFSLVKSVLNYNYTSFNNPDNKLVKRTTSSVDNLTPFSEKAANQWLESDDINPAVGYNNVLNVLSEETVKDRKTKKNSDGTYWVKYNTIKGLSYEDSQTEVDALTYAASQTSWCTASAAESHLRGGNFHILFDKNNTPVTAIRMENGKIAEERGNTPDQGLIDKYNNHLIEYKEGGFVEGYDGTSDSTKLKLEIAEARKKPFDYKKFNLYIKDIADSANPEETLKFYRKKADEHIEILAEELFVENNIKYNFEKGIIDNRFDDIAILEDGLNEFGEEIFNKTVIVPKGRKAVVSSETTGVMRINELIMSDGSIELKGFDDITIIDIQESVSSLEYSSKGYYPQIIVRDNRFKQSSQYGEVTRVNIFQGVASIAFEEGIGAVEVIENRDAWITEIAFADNNKKDGNRFRSLANIPDARVRRQIITYTPEVFDKEGYFSGTAYDATWSEGARILNQESESQSAKERYIKEHLSVGDEVTGYQRANLFDKKKDALALIKKTKADYPSLNFKVYKKSGLVTNKMDEAGKYFIHIERNPKYKETKKADTSVRAAIALVDGEAVIFALTNPNVSSVVHEMSHMYEEYLTPQEVKVIEKFSGAKRGTEQFSEAFARGFERFLADGKAPTPELKSVFSQFKEWMKNIYKAIVGSPIEKDLTPEVRTIFENMVMVEGDANFRETDFKTGNIVGPVKGGIKKLNQEAAKSGMRKLEEVNSNSKKMVAAANATKDNSSTWSKFKKAWSDRQSNIRKYMKDRGLQRAEAAMNNRAGTGARAKYKVEPIAKKIYGGLSVAQEDVLNMYLQAERIIQIEDNRQAKREYAQEKLNEFEGKKAALLETIKGKEYSKADRKIIEESIQKMDGFIAKAKEMLAKNRLYKVDENGIETGELAFKHPNGMSREDAQAAIDEMSKRPDFAVIKKRGGYYFEAMSDNLKDLYEGGLINEETYNRFKNDKYITRAFLGHIFEFQFDNEGQVIQADFDNNADFYKSIGLGADQVRALAEGSEGELIMNSRYLLEKAYQSTSARVLKNKAAQALAKDMKGQQATWFKQGNYVERKGEVLADRYGNYEANPIKGFETVYYRENGMKRAFHLEEEAFNEWNDIDLKIQRNFGMNTLRMMSGVKLLKAAATGSNPLFFLVNVPMDIAHVLFFTDVYDSNKLLPVNFVKVSRKVTKNVRGILGLDIDANENINLNVDTKNTKRVQKLMDIYMENGGGMDFMTQQGQELFDDNGNMITKASKKQKVGQYLGYTGNVTELAMRLATVEQVRENLMKNNTKNLSEAEINQIAVSKARATMDFSQGGVTAKQVDLFVPYFNAAVQAFRVTREYLSTTKGRANFANKWAQASVGVAMITFYNLMMSESDEDDTLYDDIPDYIKDNYFVFILPFQEKNTEGKVKYLRIRKTPNVAPFLNLSEAIARATYYNMKGIDDPRKGQSAISQFKRAVKSVEATLPFVPTQAGVISKMPPTIQGAMKYAANYDPFRQMALVPENEFGKISPSREGLGDERVPVFLKAFGEATGASPKRSQAVIESYTTSPTTNFLVGGAYSILDKATNMISDYDKTKQSKYANNLFGSILKSGQGRVVRDTNPNWRNYTYDDAQKIKMEEGDVNHEIKVQTAFYSKEYRDADTQEKKDLAIQEFKEFALTLRVPADRKRAMVGFRERISRDWSKVDNVDEGLAIKYAGDPEAAARTYALYFGVPNMESEKDMKKLQEKLMWLRKNFRFTPSARFKAELMRLSSEQYKK